MRISFILITIAIASFSKSFSQNIRVNNLQVESRHNPLVIDVISPDFSWQIQARQRNFIQVAYHIIVVDDSLSLLKGSGNIWDSHRQPSATSNKVLYKGKKLAPAKKYFWKVKVWNTRGESSDWSETGFFITGLFQSSDWSNAKWIGYDD